MSVLEIVIISAGLSLDVFVAMAYMGAGFSKINKKNLFGLCLLFGGVLEQRNDEIDWKKTTFLALITSVDAFLAGIGMGFLEAQMIHQSLTIFPITVLSVIGGVYVGYRLGTVHNSQAYLAGGALFLIAGVDVVIQYCMY